MATYSSILARIISWTEEPGELQSMETQRIRHNKAYTLETPSKWKDSWLWWHAAHKHVGPRLVGTWRSMTLSPTYLTTNQSEEFTSWSHLCCIITIKFLTTHFKLGHIVLRAWAHCGSFAWQSNKIVLFYFIQNSVSEIYFGVKVKRMIQL